ncbi:hypothetical protein DFH29DRAFT_806240, partial [Suillus ampliporus]
MPSIDWSDPIWSTLLPLPEVDFFEGQHGLLPQSLPPVPQSDSPSALDVDHPHHNCTLSISIIQPPASPTLPSSPVVGAVGPLAGLLSERGNNSSWAARNPTRPVIPTRSKGNALMEAQKASRAIKSAKRKEEENTLNESIKTYLEEQGKKLREIALKHNVSEDHIKNLVGYHTHYKKMRAPQLKNALVHTKAQEVNGGMYQLTVDSHVLTQTGSKRLHTSLTSQSIMLKISGSRANNIAAARDVLATTDRVRQELDGLRDRCGTYATLFVVGGHVNDQAQATWYTTDDSSHFWEDILNLVLDDVARQYEQWSCSKGQNIIERDSLENMQSQVAKYILNGLRRCQMTNKSNVTMNYPNYAKAIVITYGVMLDGWPTDIPFTSPWNIHTVSEMRTLCDALKTGRCAWQKMSAAEVDKYKANIDKRQAAGEVVGKPRKKRSDAGKSRKR